jgi:hypothetical protein
VQMDNKGGQKKCTRLQPSNLLLTGCRVRYTERENEANYLSSRTMEFDPSLLGLLRSDENG